MIYRDYKFVGRRAQARITWKEWLLLVLFFLIYGIVGKMEFQSLQQLEKWEGGVHENYNMGNR